MKRITRNLLLSLLHFISFYLFTNETKAGNPFGEVYTIDNTHLSLYDQNNKPLPLDQNQTYLIVIKNNKSCLNCFSIIQDYLVSLNADTINEWLIMESDSATLERRRTVYEAKNLFSKFSYYGVTYDQTLSNLQTPILILYHKNNFYQYNYDELFGEGINFISFSVQQKIKEILEKR